MPRFIRLTLWMLAGLLLAVEGAHAQSPADWLAVVPPAQPGSYPVGCSNVEQDFSRIAPGSDATAYWEGRGGSGSGYVTDLLVDPADAFVVDVALPDDGELYGDYRNRVETFGTLVCYPTSAANVYADYPLPTGEVVPRMQRGSQPPVFATDRPQYPVLLFSHGLGGSPLSGEYIDAIALFASHGYVVIAPFHGDARFADVRVDSFGNLLTALAQFSNYTAMQAIRPQALRAALDAVLANADFAARMDVDAIGGFGGSLGGESLLLMRGAQLTVSPGLSSKSVMNDTRLKAAVGYVPYFGQLLLPAFGRDQKGLDNVSLPYLAIAGSADTTAPAVVTGLGMLRLPGARQFVVLAGVRHGFDVEASPDIFTWSLTWLAAYVQDDREARAQSARMIRVAGGGDDVLLLDKAQPLPPAPLERLSIEYYNASLDHYFMTAEPAEAAMLDAGIIVPGWQRTGFDFKAYAVDAGMGVPACRYFGTPGIGPNTHFFSILPYECAILQASPLWMSEGTAFRVDALDAASQCPADRVPVIRLYNNGKGGEANHRYLTSHSEVAAMLLEGWIIEGPVFCSLP